MEASADDRQRILITLAIGTGKTSSRFSLSGNCWMAAGT
jgi:type I site-specific restriction endonuclease